MATTRRALPFALLKTGQGLRSDQVLSFEDKYDRARDVAQSGRCAELINTFDEAYSEPFLQGANRRHESHRADSEVFPIIRRQGDIGGMVPGGGSKLPDNRIFHI
ncbi:MAG TPA: hypothetical protein VMB04_02600 [Mycobacterium sp.]|nr:hypothetical protein [Mycobacterium sp.]